jgi:hypothetical protein
MDKAGAGLETMGDAAVDALNLFTATMPQWFALFERFVDNVERGVNVAEDAAVRSGLATPETVARSHERAGEWIRRQAAAHSNPDGTADE